MAVTYVDQWGHPVPPGSTIPPGSIAVNDPSHSAPTLAPTVAQSNTDNPYAIDPQIQSLLDAWKAAHQSTWTDAMQIAPKIENAGDQINPNTQGLDQYRSEALRTGPSKWAGLMTQQQQAGQQQTSDSARNNAEAMAAQQRANMAGTSGLSTGAAERINRGMYRDAMFGQNAIASQGEQQRLDIGAQDESHRLQQLQNLPGMENTAIQPQLAKLGLTSSALMGDVANQRSGIQDQNSFLTDYYNKIFGVGAGNQVAQSINSTKQPLQG